jgi:hypothetical protein
MQETLQKMGISPEQMREIEEEIRRRLGDMGGPSLGTDPDPQQP